MEDKILMYCEMWEETSILDILDLALENEDINEEEYDKFYKLYIELEENDEDTADLEVIILDFLGVTDGVFEDYLDNK